ncbi:hypothetical protein CAEBREN_13866 [Caenorhabditis brenneri]|uniref:F-box domain-containing protein n=1 Tax=Caenorhabditis brenneri TaxID=135651 RepID=G0NQR7_CAEBE|nr:hypothetical protein CAEBREN_13866 [Caenorhabditis brenneri]
MDNFSRLVATLRNFSYAMAERDLLGGAHNLKLMDFPTKVFEMILRRMNVIEVFNLSIISKMIRTKILLANIQIDCLEVICDGVHQKIILRNHWKDPVLQFTFDGKPAPFGWMLGKYKLKIRLCGKLKSGYHNLETLLHKYHHLEGLFIAFRFCRTDFDHREILTLNRVCFVDASWFTREDLLNSRFQNLKLLFHNLNSEDINAFIKHWLASDDTRFNRLELMCQPGKRLNKLQVTKDLDIMLWEKQRRESEYLIDHIQSPYLTDTRQGFDIERKDGLLATILIKENSFMFCVWHRRFYRPEVQEYPRRTMKLLNNL